MSNQSTDLSKNQPNKNQPNIATQTVVYKSDSSRSIYSVFHMIVSLFALYLSFKCNDGFDFGSILMACFCPYIYIIYKFATSENFCGIKSVK
jgi:hypothetical protein